MLNHIIAYLEKRSRPIIFLICIFLSVIIGIADYFTNPEISSGIFYILPIAIASWFGDKKLSRFFAILASIIWFICDTGQGRSYSHQIIGYWNAFVRLSFIRKIQIKLLTKMRMASWPVTFSIGTVTFEKPPQNVDTAMTLADTVMYGVKKSSKNNMAHIAWPEV